MKDVIVKKSKLHGQGVFAARDFAKDEIVLKWNYTELTKKDFDELPKNEKRFVSKFGKQLVLFHAPDRYVNHSGSPNTKIKGKTNIAVRAIRSGEEITTDYTKEGVKIDFTYKNSQQMEPIKIIRIKNPTKALHDLGVHMNLDMVKLVKNLRKNL